MKRIILLFIILFVFTNLASSQKTERYSYKTPIIAIFASGTNYNGYNYDWNIRYSLNTFNCRWLSHGVVAGPYNATLDNYYVARNIINNTSNELIISNSYYLGIAGINQVPFYARAFVQTKNGIYYSDNVKLSADGALPTVATTNVSSIGTGSAYSGGIISSDGGSSITAKGVCWNTYSNPTVSNSHTNDGTGTNTYTSYLSGLSENTTYYVRAYATNSTGTGYGNEVQFTTQQAIYVPDVTTAIINSITSNSASSGGNVTYTGGGTITERGVCWNTAGSPNYNNSKTNDGTGIGSYTSSITGLTANTTYYVRAYAIACGEVNGHNVCALGYGQQESFITLTSGMLANVQTNSVAEITESSALLSGQITSDGGSSVTTRGFCYGTSQYPTLSNNIVSAGYGTGSFSANINSLTCGTTYYVRSYATNNSGTAYGNQVSFTTGTTNYPDISLWSAITNSGCPHGDYNFTSSLALAQQACQDMANGCSGLSGYVFKGESFSVGTQLYYYNQCNIRDVTGYWIHIEDGTGNKSIVYLLNGVIQSITACP